MSVTERIRFLLSEQKKSINQMATALGMGSGTFATWESAGRTPNGDTLAKIADYFNVSVDYLLGRTAPADDLPGLGEVERQLVENYRAMNAEGQERLFSTSDDLVQSGKYKKHDASCMGREA